MKSVEIKNWIVKDKEGKEVEDSFLNVINYVISVGQQKDNLAGFDNMRKLNRVGLAMDEAIKTKKLSLEDDDYKFIKELINKHSPAIWGTNPNIMDSVTEFMELK